MKSDPNSNPMSLDLLVVGGGLAGCAMVWQALRRGLNVALVDQLSPQSSSRVAAGLVTPITGNRLALSWKFNEFFIQANELYRYAETQQSTSFWSVAPALRIFSSEQEHELFQNRWARPEYLAPNDSLHLRVLTAEELDGFHATYGGFMMSPAARLNTQVYIDSTRRLLDGKGLLFERAIDLHADMIPIEQEFEFPSLQIRAGYVCLAQGIDARSNRWFDTLPLHPARGDILRVCAKTPQVDQVVHGDGWLVPLERGEFLVGATYARDAQACVIDSPVGIAAREELLGRWDSFFKPPAPIVERIDQRAAVRPASYDRHPLIGSHPTYPKLCCLNGLGSKGSLMAPMLANQLLDHLQFGTPIDGDLDWSRREAK
ncbi:MAG: NAD(P)/FAD-dependent oxidoreductase [Pirellula sp.]